MILYITVSLMLYHRVKKRKRAEPIPRNAFPHVVVKVSALDFSFPYLI